MFAMSWQRPRSPLFSRVLATQTLGIVATLAASVALSRVLQTPTVYSLKATLEEADVARRNRSASVCLFVHSAQTAPAGIPELHRWGSDIVVVWDAEDPATDVRLKAGYLLAKALCVRANQHDEDEAASLAEMDVAIEAIRKQIAGFEEIRTSARTIVNGGEKILSRARLMEEEITRRLVGLDTQLDRLRAATADSPA